MTFKAGCTYRDTVGRKWLIMDIFRDAFVASLQNWHIPHDCLGFVDDNERAIIRLPNGFTTIYADTEDEE